MASLLTYVSITRGLSELTHWGLNKQDQFWQIAVPMFQAHFSLNNYKDLALDFNFYQLFDWLTFAKNSNHIFATLGDYVLYIYQSTQFIYKCASTLKSNIL